MTQKQQTFEFESKILKPQKPGVDFDAFVILPKAISDELPRRGRVTVELSFSDYSYQVTLEPDGNLSHWAKLTENDLKAANVVVGEACIFHLNTLPQEPEPKVPDDFNEALIANAKAHETWSDTTPIARLDWIHWVESAKQAKTRSKRINDACQTLEEGKRRVCCFDNSGFYSKALKVPKFID